MHEARVSSIPECVRHNDCDKNDDEDVSSCSAESVAAIECVCVHAAHERSTTINLYARVTICFLQVKQAASLQELDAPISSPGAHGRQRRNSLWSHMKEAFSPNSHNSSQIFASHLRTLLLQRACCTDFAAAP